MQPIALCAPNFMDWTPPLGVLRKKQSLKSVAVLMIRKVISETH